MSRKLFSSLHRQIDFIQSTLPKRGTGRFDELFVHEVCVALKELADIQEKNAWVTLNFRTGDGLWAFYQGGLAFILVPAKGHIRLIIGRAWQNAGAKALLAAVKSSPKADSLFQKTLHEKQHDQWLLNRPSLKSFVDMVRSLEVFSSPSSARRSRSVRAFSSAVRRLALEDFQRNGSWCTGVDRPGHQVNFQSGERIEFDHELPYSKNGSSSEYNCQVLCAPCNRSKHAKIV